MQIFLHHYQSSLFSEKIRAILGYLDLDWFSVETSIIMPRPLLMPLTGGYRRTPNLQIDSNVYCDSAMIGRALARHTGQEALFAPGFAAHRVAEWADNQLFRTVVALNFAPAAVGAMFGNFEGLSVEDFAKDRAELTGGQAMQSFSAESAASSFDHTMVELEESLCAPFLFGANPSIADFSVYHCLWFLRNNPVNAPRLDRFANILAWLARIAAFGHGRSIEATGEQALATAKATEPVLPAIATALPPEVSLGSRVHATPVDYGLVPVEGELVGCSAHEIVLLRETPETGPVMTHFPRAGFDLTAV